MKIGNSNNIFIFNLLINKKYVLVRRYVASVMVLIEYHCNNFNREIKLVKI